MRNQVVVLVLLVLAMMVSAATFNHGSSSAVKTGLLASSQASDGASANEVICDGAASVDVATAISGTATVVIEGSIDGGTTRFTVSGSSHTVSTRLTISNPIGPYRTSVSSCAGCLVTAKYACVWRVNRTS